MDYISLTDMANGRQDESRAADVIKNWIRTRYTIEFLGTWEMIHNPNFKVVEFDHFRMQAGLPSFTLSASEWIEKTNAIGIVVKRRRYGGTYAFKDIAFEFGTAISSQLCRKLPGQWRLPLTNLKKTHLVFDAGQITVSNSPIAIGELECGASQRDKETKDWGYSKLTNPSFERLSTIHIGMRTQCFRFIS